VTVRAVFFDFGGVISSGPFESFARYERERGLPEGFIRSLNAARQHDNAWARFERGEVDLDGFCHLFEAEARAAGGEIDAREVLSRLGGEIRPEMVEAVRRCRERLATGLLTNAFVTPDSEGPAAEVIGLFDVVVASSTVGFRKPEQRFYEIACERLAIAAHEAVFLDDLGVNLRPARDMGMVTIKVTDPAEALAELEKVVGFALRDPPDLSRSPS
jgi:putative hydrolase of the HAD superfamily